MTPYTAVGQIFPLTTTDILCQVIMELQLFSSFPNEMNL